MESTYEMSQPMRKNGRERNQGRTGRRSFCLLATAFAVTVAVLILVFILLWTQIPRSSASAPLPTPTNVCNSEACISASALLQRSIDLSADPCQDFYSFACGGFQRRSPYDRTSINTGLSLVTDDVSEIGGKLFELFYKPELATSEDPEMNRMYQAVREMFLSCIAWNDPSTWWLPHKPNSLWNQSQMMPMNVEMLQMSLLKQIDNPKNLEDFLAKLVMTKSSGLVRISENQTESEVFNYLMQARHKGPVMSFETMQFTFDRAWNDTDVDIIEKLCRRLKLPLTSLKPELQETQRRFSKGNTSSVFTGTLQQLQNETSLNLSSPLAFNWTAFIRHLYDGPMNSDLPIVVYQFAEFLSALKQLASEFATPSPKGSLYDLIRVDAVMSMQSNIPTDCVHFAMTAMKPVVYDMYKRAYLKDHNLTLINSLITDIEEAMEQNVDEESWIQKTSKDAIKIKIHNLKHVVSFYEPPAAEIKFVLKRPMELFSKAKNFGDIVLMQKDVLFRQEIWFMTSQTPLHDVYATLWNPFEINAFYNQQLNSINILTGIIDSFLFDREYPDYILFGGIGIVIGHEIAHGLDPQGCHYDSNGVFVKDTIFDLNTRSRYFNNSMCLMKSYDQLAIAPNSTRVNGTQTVTENFSDIVGINAVFRAYRNSLARSRKAAQLLPGPLPSRLTPDQLFFVQAAQFDCNKMEAGRLHQMFQGDSHSPPRARVLGTMLHSKDFGRVFGCKPGDRMHLSDADKCHNW